MDGGEYWFEDIGDARVINIFEVFLLYSMIYS